MASGAIPHGIFRSFGCGERLKTVRITGFRLPPEEWDGTAGQLEEQIADHPGMRPCEFFAFENPQMSASKFFGSACSRQ